MIPVPAEAEKNIKNAAENKIYSVRQLKNKENTMIADSLENIPLYKYGEALEKAVAFVRTLDKNTPDGRQELGNKMYANVMTYTTREEAVTFLEIHKKYVDLQVVIEGCEALCACEKSSLDVQEEYKEEEDYAFLTPAEERKPLSRLELVPGTFALFFPQDAHIGQRAGKGGCMPIKKVVVKIPLELM